MMQQDDADMSRARALTASNGVFVVEVSPRHVFSMLVKSDDGQVDCRLLKADVIRESRFRGLAGPEEAHGFRPVAGAS